MNIEQTLHKLQGIIHETLPNLELFVDHNIQPTSSDCENLQKQLNSLQEYLSVFKHLKTNKEISPSFDIHLKVSEAVANKSDIISEDVIKHKEIEQEEVHVKKPNSLHHEIEQLRTVSSKEENSTGKKVEISLNQKFQFINELFNKNATEYGLAVDQLNLFSNWQDAESYLLSLKSAYGWKDSNENYKRLKELSHKRFE